MLTPALSPGTHFREHCAEDIEELCEQQADQIALAEGYGADSQVIGCLEVRSLAGFVRLRLGGSTDKRQGGLWGRAAMQQCISGRMMRCQAAWWLALSLTPDVSVWADPSTGQRSKWWGSQPARLCRHQPHSGGSTCLLVTHLASDGLSFPFLQTQRDRIRSKRCREEVHRQMQHEAEDLRFDHELAKACHRYLPERYSRCGAVAWCSACSVHH